MILSYADKDTEMFDRGERVKRFEGFAHAARKKLDRLIAAKDLEELGMLPGNRLEKLRGDRGGQFSIRVNAQWRICFEWSEHDSGFVGVEIVDYH